MDDRKLELSYLSCTEMNRVPNYFMRVHRSDMLQGRLRTKRRTINQLDLTAIAVHVEIPSGDSNHRPQTRTICERSLCWKERQCKLILNFG